MYSKTILVVHSYMQSFITYSPARISPYSKHQDKRNTKTTKTTICVSGLLIHFDLAVCV